MQKVIKIGNKEVAFKATAYTLKLYREMFQRDALVDMAELETYIGSDNPQIRSLEVFSDLAYCMAKQANPDMTESVDEWLDGFEVFDIYLILPEILELWQGNNVTTVEARKK